MKVQNDYKLLYLYYLGDNEGKLKIEHQSEYERLKALYSIDEAKQEAKDALLKSEHIYSTQEGYFEHGDFILTKEDKENPFKITQKGLDALDKRVFESETAKKITEKGDRRLSRISVIVAICVGVTTLIGWFRTDIASLVITIYDFFSNLFVKTKDHFFGYLFADILFAIEPRVISGFYVVYQ